MAAAAAAAGALRALDIEEQQVALNFAGDTYEWHQRVLMVSGGGGKWVVLTPDLDLENEDLTQHVVVALGRAAPLPQRIAGSFYGFDALAEADLRRLRGEARSLARAIGFDIPGAAPAGAAATRWLCGDPGHAQFGLELAAGVSSDPERFIERGATALVNVSATAEADWTFYENVATNDEDAWKEEKQNGPGRDTRILPVVKTARGGRRTTLSGALAHLKAAERKDWPFRGPRAVVEFLEGIESTGLDLAGYYGHWVRQSGVHPAAGCALELKNLLEVMRHLLLYDQVNVANLAGAELVARRCLQIQRAVRKSPRSPCFAGLESMLSSALDETGGVVTSKFDEFVAAEQKTAANILKQQRLWSDEIEQDKRKNNAGDDAQGSAKGGKGKKKEEK